MLDSIGFGHRRLDMRGRPCSIVHCALSLREWGLHPCHSNFSNRSGCQCLECTMGGTSYCHHWRLLAWHTSRMLTGGIRTSHCTIRRLALAWCIPKSTATRFSVCRITTHRSPRGCCMFAPYTILSTSHCYKSATCTGTPSLQ